MYRGKKVIIMVMIIGIFLMITGYAVFSSNLKINGTANIETTWEVLFTKIEKINVIGKATELSFPVASGTTATFQVGLTKPGDGIEYRITVSNRGDFDAVIESIEALERGNDVVKFEIKNIKKGDKLLKKSSSTFNVKVYFDESITDHPGQVENNLTIEMKYSQNVGQSVPSETPVIKSTKLATRILQDNVAISDTSIDFSKISSDTNGKGLYYTSTNTEGGKRTYYFRGAVENNYVSFAGHIWRIVRINEDGSVRLIKKDSIGSSIFNTNAGDNAFLGYMHGTPTTYQDGVGIYNGVWTSASASSIVKMSTTYTFNSTTGDYTLINPIDGNYTSSYHNYYTCMSSSKVICKHMAKITSTATRGTWNDLSGAEFHTAYFSTSYEQAHKNEVSSTLKTYIDNWYKSNLTSYSSYLIDAGFCNDRSVTNNVGYAQLSAFYGAENRLVANKKPQFKCPNEGRDLFTTTISTKGNKSLIYPIGLITADEMVYAGAVYSIANNSYYLYDGKTGWTMTPYGFNTADRLVRQWNVISNRSLYSSGVLINSHEVRPVINLKANSEIADGDGTSSKPYVIGS